MHQHELFIFYLFVWFIIFAVHIMQQFKLKRHHASTK